MRAIALKLMLSTALIIPWSCVEDDCGGLQNQKINTVGITVNNTLLLEGGYSIEKQLVAEEKVSYKRFGLQVLPEVAYLSMVKDKLKSSFISAAYACSPMSVSTEEIQDIAIFSDEDYIQKNSQKVVVAGDTLNSLFNIYDYNSGRIVGLPDFLIDKGLEASEEGFILQPAVAPEQEQKHEFTIHYRLTNGEFYEVSAEAIILQP